MANFTISLNLNFSIGHKSNRIHPSILYITPEFNGSTYAALFICEKHMILAFS